MSAVVDLRKTDDPRDALHRAVHLLSEGQLVVFPTETAYAVCAQSLVPAAVLQLTKNGRNEPVHPTLLVKSFQEAVDYVPWIDRLGARLGRRCWPGPVTLSFDVLSEDGLLQSLPAETRQSLVPDGRIWLRVPAHEWIQEAGRLMPAPLVSGAETDAEGNPLSSAVRVLAAYGEVAALVIDDGETRYSQPATVVHVADNSWSIVQPGVVTETMVGRLACQVFIFVCTGNTCRSPLAEGFFRKFLADALRCAEDELSDRGYLVLSAGLSAEPGLPASPEAVQVARRFGVDLRPHESQPLTDRLLQQSDRILTMTRNHKDAILSSHPHLGDRVELLARDQSDIPDPIGAGHEEYEICRVAIERNLRALLETMNLDSHQA